MDHDFFEKAQEEQMNILLDFGADWCSTCKPVEAMLENDIIPKWDHKIMFAKVNVQERPELAEKYGVLSVPTVILCSPDDNVLWRKSGYIRQDEVEEMLENQ